MTASVVWPRRGGGGVAVSELRGQVSRAIQEAAVIAARGGWRPAIVLAAEARGLTTRLGLDGASAP